MEYIKCIFFGLQSKKKLNQILNIERDVYDKASFINSRIKVYLNGDSRLIEAPDEDIKAIQRTIMKGLQTLEVPDFVYSGIKKKDSVQAAVRHLNYDFVFTADIRKFFYNVSRERVYSFFKDKLKTSPDVAEILANFCAIDLRLKGIKQCSIAHLINSGEILPNHLIAGSPVSTILSYLANEELFGEMQAFAVEKKLNFSVYVDDMIFSSAQDIQEEIRSEILNIVKKHGYVCSENKIKYYRKGDIKNIVGVVTN